MTDKGEKFETWGVLELFGRVKLAGWITEQVVGGVHFIRIDVPECENVPAHTRFFTGPAIYGMSPTTEEVARAIAGRLLAKPVQSYEMPRLSMPAAGVERWHGGEYDDVHGD